MWESMALGHTVLQWGMVGMLAKGGAMMLPLLAASVTSLTVIIARGVFWHRLRKHDVDTALLPYVAAGEIAQALTLSHASAHPVVRVPSAGLASQHQMPRIAMEATAHAEMQRVKAY